MTFSLARLSSLDRDDRMPGVAVGLVLLAAAPLWVAAIVALAPGLGGDAHQAVAAGQAWAALLVAFGGGVRWGIALGPIGAVRRMRDFLAAAGFVIVAAGVLFAPPAVGLALALVSFLLQALWDVTAGDEGRVPGWCVRLRLLATMLLVLPVLALLVRVSLPVS